MFARCRSTVLTLMKSSVGDLLGRVALGDELEDLLLARGEHLVGQAPRRGAPVEVVADEGGDSRPGRGRARRASPPGRPPPGRGRRRTSARIRAAPALSASKKYCSLSCIVSMRIRRLGSAPGQLSGGLQAGHPGHGDVEDGQVDVVGAGQVDGLRAVAGLGDDLQVRLAVEDEPYAAADQRMVVGEQDAESRRSACVMAGVLTGTGSRAPRSPPAGGWDRDIQVGADQQGPLAHPADPGAFAGAPQAAAVVARRASTTASPAVAQATSTGAASAWRAALVRLSWATR